LSTKKTATTSAESVETQDERVMHMLHDHVPLALLCDLTTPEGPESAEILAEEGQPVQAWWRQ
jgi:hypothetical protein